MFIYTIIDSLCAHNTFINMYSSTYIIYGELHYEKMLILYYTPAKNMLDSALCLYTAN